MCEKEKPRETGIIMTEKGRRRVCFPMAAGRTAGLGFGMATKPSTRNRAKGAMREAKGRIKEAAGKQTRNQREKGEEKVQAGVGRAQRKRGEAERDFDKDLSKDID